MEGVRLPEAGGVCGVVGPEDSGGRRCHLRIAAFGGTLTGPPPHIQDVDSRDRRRRELERPEQQEPREPPEPSTSWWPVSSAEKKKNVTLVRAGPVWGGQNGGGGVTEDAVGRHRASEWWLSREAGLSRGVMVRHLELVEKTFTSHL